MLLLPGRERNLGFWSLSLGMGTPWNLSLSLRSPRISVKTPGPGFRSPVRGLGDVWRRQRTADHPPHRGVARDRWRSVLPHQGRCERDNRSEPNPRRSGSWPRDGDTALHGPAVAVLRQLARQAASDRYTCAIADVAASSWPLQTLWAPAARSSVAG